ncbi:hypothetical protein GCM10010277_56550 [Streptomyces longisporoflavus]|nr:hypothetical protein GCM10010277_56550 [Streptomyces longisporoflavus]
MSFGTNVATFDQASLRPWVKSTERLMYCWDMSGPPLDGPRTPVWRQGDESPTARGFRRVPSPWISGATARHGALMGRPGDGRDGHIGAVVAVRMLTWRIRAVADSSDCRSHPLGLTACP